MGAALDRGARALYWSVALVTVGAATGFGVLYACAHSELAAWFVIPAILALSCSVVVTVGLPVTRLYRCAAPLC